MEELLKSTAELITKFGLKLIAALIVLFVGIKLSNWLSKRAYKLRTFSALDDGVRRFLVNTIKILLYVLVIISAAGILGIPYASFVAVLGSAGVAIGLALQGSLSNIAAGILILINKPFRVGDFIEAGSIQGTVTEIGFFNTVIITIDNKTVHYPNSALSNICIINYSAKELRRVDMDFSVSYESNITLVRDVLLRIITEHPLTLSEPEPFVRLSKHDESALVFTVRVWCETPNYWDIYFDLLEKVKTEFDKNGIEIPYNKLDVYVKGK